MNLDELENQLYLGDGVYVGIVTGTYLVVLYTSNGITVTNKILLEPEVIDAFKEWLENK